MQTQHEYLLARQGERGYVALADADPLYEQFATEVLGDAYLAMLLSIFEHTTESYLSTNMHTRHPLTVASRPVIILDGAQAGVLRDVQVHQGGAAASVELALGLGYEGAFDSALARQNMPRAMAALLLELVGPKPPSRPTEVWIDEPTTPALAFWVGFEAAFDAVYAQQHPELPLLLQQGQTLMPEERDRLLRYTQVPSNGLRYRFEGDAPTLSPHPREEAARTPGVVAAFLYRLLQTTGSYYPQRYLLWFNAYEGEEIAYGKLLLASGRMAERGEVSIEAFITSYRETFPAEGRAVEALAEEMLGEKS